MDGTQTVGDLAALMAMVDHGVFPTGTPEQIADGLDRYRTSGVDEIVLNVAGTLVAEGLDAAVTDLSDVLAAVAPRACASRAG